MNWFLNCLKNCKCIALLYLIASLNALTAHAQVEINSVLREEKLKHVFWKLSGQHAIAWNLTKEQFLPHSDNIEMSGQKVAAIIHYEVDTNKRVHVNRNIIFPQLRTNIKSTSPEWDQYRAYLSKVYEDDLLPIITVEERTLELGVLDSITINGKLNLFHAAQQGLKVHRSFLPSMTERLFVEKWRIENITDSTKVLNIGNTQLSIIQAGLNGTFTRAVTTDASDSVELNPGEHYEFGIYFSAQLDAEMKSGNSFQAIERQRDQFLYEMRNSLIVNTPDPILNTLFYFSKIRASESIYATKMGLVHSPGGGRYYTGVWANDQAEYSGPFFPYLGYPIGDEAAMNAYRMFLKNIPPAGGKMWASFEMDGDLPCCSKDRGDAAMIAYGASQFALALGDKKKAEELWPLIEWAINYSENKKNVEGVIKSDSDELEGRFPTGTANLSTSSLHYGALMQASALAKALNKPALSKEYIQKAGVLATAIERYFGTTLSGLQTYKYYKENTTLRSWICLPLVVGIEQRKEGTLEALFSKLWTVNGVKIEDNPNTKGPEVFWDRGTLYAFRGAFKAGASDKALEKLVPFSKTRLLGFHVPYVVEAWPEGGMAHLSAESALYCRIFTEGILGITPMNFNSFSLRPHLPSAWQYINIKSVKAFNTSFDISVKRKSNNLQIEVMQGSKVVLSKTVKEGATVNVKLTR